MKFLDSVFGDLIKKHPEEPDQGLQLSRKTHAPASLFYVSREEIGLFHDLIELHRESEIPNEFDYDQVRRTFRSTDNPEEETNIEGGIDQVEEIIDTWAGQIKGEVGAALLTTEARIYLGGFLLLSQLRHENDEDEFDLTDQGYLFATAIRLVERVKTHQEDERVVFAHKEHLPLQKPEED